MFRIALSVLALMLAFATSAQAAHHHRHRHHVRAPAHHRFSAPPMRASAEPSCDNNGRCIQMGAAVGNATGYVPLDSSGVAYALDAGRVVSHPAGCAWRAFCGCGASVEVFGHPVRELFLAANWRRFPSAAPGPGMVAWRYGHVFVIRSVVSPGVVVAYDANSGGHLTRVHTVSLRGYRVVNPHGGGGAFARL